MVDINKLKQFQNIDNDLLKAQRRVEALRESPLGSMIEQIKQASLRSQTLGVFDHSNLREVIVAQSAQGTIFGSSILQMEATLRNSIIEIAKNSISNNFQSIISSQFSSVFESLGKSQYEAIQSTMQNLKHQLSLDLSSSLVDFRNLGIATNLSITKIIAEIAKSQTSLTNQSMIDNFSRIALDHSRFMNNTLTSLGAFSNSQITNALKGSLLLANEQTIRSASLMQPFLENSTTNIKQTFPYVRTNRFRVQKIELLKRNDLEESETYENLVVKSPSATIFEQIVECMLLIGECNEASETTNGKPIFKITTSFWNSAWNLQRLVATNKNNLETVVLCLYQIVYEGAGEDNLRFLDYVDADEANVVFVLKHFRNKWLIHDVDHGKESKIQKSFKERREALEWLGLEKTPTKLDDFVTLNSSLLFKLREFLTLLLERVAVFPKE